MAAPALDIDREEVRMLVMSVGPRQAARQCNLNENTVLQWTSRYGWLDHLKKPPLEKPKSMMPIPVINVISPADALASTLSDNKRRTKLAQSSYLVKASEKLDQVADPLEYTDAALQLATMATKVYPEAPTQSNAVVVTVNLSGKADHFESVQDILEGEWQDISSTNDQVDAMSDPDL